jgi:hypothetical protein
MSTLFLVAFLAALVFFFYMIAATIGNAPDRRIAVIGAAVGAAAGVGFVAVVASVTYVALFFGTGTDEHFGRGILAAFVLVFAALPALVMGLIGCAVGARRGADWRPDVPLALDNWTAPDTAEVQRVVEGRIE